MLNASSQFSGNFDLQASGLGNKGRMIGLLTVWGALGKRIHTRRSLRAGALSLLLASASMGTLSACGNISVTDRTPPTPPQQRLPVTQETHDLAIAAVDFDPTLNSHQLSAGRQYYLLVAVENKGNRRETSFNVTAQL